MYKWKDQYGAPLELGDNVIDVDHDLGGYITTDEAGTPVFFATHKLKCYWEPLDNKGPNEMYMKPLFDNTKSKWYWRRHHYILDNILKGDRNEFRN